MTDFSLVERSIAEIARICHMPWCTVNWMIKKFERSRQDIDTFLAKKPRDFRCLPADVKRFLLSKETLQNWAPFGLKERCRLLSNSPFGITISENTLMHFYRSN